MTGKPPDWSFPEAEQDLVVFSPPCRNICLVVLRHSRSSLLLVRYVSNGQHSFTSSFMTSGIGDPKRRGTSTSSEGSTLTAIFSYDADKVRRLVRLEVTLGDGEGAEVESPITLPISPTYPQINTKIRRLLMFPSAFRRPNKSMEFSCPLL